MSQEVMTFTDKDKRDAAYQDLRKNGDSLERQVVRFSSCEKTGEKIMNYISMDRFELRPVYRSTWSLAYPRS
jgi:hypothetical protein